MATFEIVKISRFSYHQNMSTFILENQRSQPHPRFSSDDLMYMSLRLCRCCGSSFKRRRGFDFKGKKFSNFLQFDF